MNRQIEAKEEQKKRRAQMSVAIGKVNSELWEFEKMMGVSIDGREKELEKLSRESGSEAEENRLPG